MQIIGVTDAAKRLKVNPSRIRVLCALGRVEGAYMMLRAWHIPLPLVIYSSDAKKTPPPKIRFNKLKR